MQNNRLKMKALASAVWLLLTCLSSNSVFAQEPEPKLKPTLLDLNTTTSSFGSHFHKLFSQENEPEFATWLGIPQAEIKKRGIKKITFKGQGNNFYGPEEAGDMGSHDKPFISEDQVEIRIDTLPPVPDLHFAFSYEFNQKGKLVAADLPKSGYGVTIHIRRWYHPDGKLKESRYVSYDSDRNRSDTLVRSYQGFVLTYDNAGRKTEKLEYYQSIESHYYSSFDNPDKKSGYYFEKTRRLWKTKFKYDPEGKLIASCKYLLPDSGQTGQKMLYEAAYYFYDSSGKLQRKLALAEIHKASKYQSTGGRMEETFYSYKGASLHRVIKNEFTFSEAWPDTLKAAQGEIAVDSATLGSPYYILVGSKNNPGPHPFIRPYSTPDTVYFLQPGQTRSHYRNYYFRQDEAGRLDLVYNFTEGAQKRRFGNNLLEAWTNNGKRGYECRFIWLNRRSKPVREVWVERYNSGWENRYFYCENYPDDRCNTIKKLTTHKRITVIDQRNIYRLNGLPKKIIYRASFNKEALRKVGEKNPRPEWAEQLLVPCRPCEPCEKLKQFIIEEPEWPYRSSAAREFTNFKYQYW